MAEKKDSTYASSVSAAAAPRPTITLPPRPSFETFFSGGPGVSPGPMTLVSSFFADTSPNSDGFSFSQLLAGAMASPAAISGAVPGFFLDNSRKEEGSGDGNEGNMGFKQSRPMNLMVARSPLFMVSPGLSPSGFFSPQSPFGISHQQALAQVTAQAALAQSHMHFQAEYPPSSVATSAEMLTQHPSYMPNAAMQQQMPSLTSEPKISAMESSEHSHSEKKLQAPSLVVDKPADDGYNWRKYGQKQVKGSEYPRSYYKCTHLHCPVKKKVERSLDGQITEIIYKGQHNHELPQPNKRTREGSDLIGPPQAKPEPGLLGQTENLNKSNENASTHLVPGRDGRTTQVTSTQLTGSSDGEEVDDAQTKAEERDEDEPNPKRRNTEIVTSEIPSSHKTVTESRIIVQTRSEVDLLDDGYRWRKYGQKVVKGNPHPRSYYKCTFVGCNVRKHVERASTDPKAVITTYEGKHNHDVPAARNSGYNTANSNATLLKPHKVLAEKHAMDFGNNDQRAVVLRLKEEQITV